MHNNLSDGIRILLCYNVVLCYVRWKICLNIFKDPVCSECQPTARFAVVAKLVRYYQKLYRFYEKYVVYENVPFKYGIQQRKKDVCNNCCQLDKCLGIICMDYYY